jgi:hypothetical protein
MDAGLSDADGDDSLSKAWQLISKHNDLAQKR